MSWYCKKCTFLNPPSPKPTFQICFLPSSPPPSALSSQSCKACTFLHSYENANCEICDTRASLWTMSSKRKRGDQVVGGSGDRVEVSRIGGAKDGSEKVAAKVHRRTRGFRTAWIQFLRLSGQENTRGWQVMPRLGFMENTKS